MTTSRLSSRQRGSSAIVSFGLTRLDPFPTRPPRRRSRFGNRVCDERHPLRGDSRDLLAQPLGKTSAFYLDDAVLFDKACRKAIPEDHHRLDIPDPSLLSNVLLQPHRTSTHPA
jgi:hypothetical protein